MTRRGQRLEASGSPASACPPSPTRSASGRGAARHGYQGPNVQFRRPGGRPGPQAWEAPVSRPVTGLAWDTQEGCPRFARGRAAAGQEAHKAMDPCADSSFSCR